MAAVAPIQPFNHPHSSVIASALKDDSALHDDFVPMNDRLIADLLAGLRKPIKEVSPMWLYDERGSELFDAISEQPEYYPTRTELKLMERHAGAMAERIGHDAALIEFGSGTSMKTRLLLDHLHEPRAYVPIDVAGIHLLDAAGAIAREYPSLAVMPLCADFTKPFDLPAKAAAAERRVVYFPGSTLGNFDPPAAKRLLQSIHHLVGLSGAALIGLDLKKDAAALERAYQDAAGFTEQFNFNCLRHLNREAQANFALSQFEHQVLWVEAASRIEMRLISRRDQVVMVAGEPIHFDAGEYVRTICSYKYTLESFAQLAAAAGFDVREVWLDDEYQFSVQLLEPRTPRD